MAQCAARLVDITIPRFIPILRAGDPDRSAYFAPAADECEVRAPLQAIAELLNDVAFHMGCQVKIVGGGSGRSGSNADYLIKLCHPHDLHHILDDNTDDNRSIASGKDRRNLVSGNVLGCFEVKGWWQVHMQSVCTVFVQ